VVSFWIFIIFLPNKKYGTSKNMARIKRMIPMSNDPSAAKIKAVKISVMVITDINIPAAIYTLALPDLYWSSVG
jgi:hypothetical protein